MEDVVYMQLKKWGGSYGFRIPSHILSHLNIVENTVLALKIVDGCLVIKPIHNNILKSTVPNNFTFNLKKRGTEDE